MRYEMVFGSPSTWCARLLCLLWPGMHDVLCFLRVSLAGRNAAFCRICIAECFTTLWDTSSNFSEGTPSFIYGFKHYLSYPLSGFVSQILPAARPFRQSSIGLKNRLGSFRHASRTSLFIYALLGNSLYASPAILANFGAIITSVDTKFFTSASDIYKSDEFYLVSTAS